MEFYQFKDLLVTLLVGAAVLIPVVGVTARFALGPLIEKFTRARTVQIETLAGEVGALRTDVEGLRDELRQQETELKRLRDATDFERQLKG
jgi:predicted phage tail protein